MHFQKSNKVKENTKRRILLVSYLWNKRGHLIDEKNYIKWYELKSRNQNKED